MKIKAILTTGLLIFVGVSVVVALRGDRPMDGSRTSDVNGVSTDQVVQIESGVAVYYLHRAVRCVTCNTIEAYTRQVVESDFAEAQAEGTLQMVSLNYQAAVNEHFVREFELTSSSVVLVRLEAGQVTEWKNLDRVWELVNDASAFSAYTQAEIQTFLAGAS